MLNKTVLLHVTIHTRESDFNVCNNNNAVIILRKPSYTTSFLSQTNRTDDQKLVTARFRSYCYNEDYSMRMRVIATIGVTQNDDDDCDAVGDCGVVDADGFLGAKEDASGLMVGDHGKAVGSGVVQRRDCQ